jgi:hypothetical protein
MIPAAAAGFQVRFRRRQPDPCSPLTRTQYTTGPGVITAVTARVIVTARVTDRAGPLSEPRAAQAPGPAPYQACDHCDACHVTVALETETRNLKNMIIIGPGST